MYTVDVYLKKSFKIKTTQHSIKSYPTTPDVTRTVLSLYGHFLKNLPAHSPILSHLLFLHLFPLYIVLVEKDQSTLADDEGSISRNVAKRKYT